MTEETIDALAHQVIRGAALATARGVPSSGVAEAFFRAAVGILISTHGANVAVATLRDAAARLDEQPEAASIYPQDLN